jgi:hypothetical protein
MNTPFLVKVSDSHGDDYEDDCLLVALVVILVIVLTIGLEVREFKPGRDHGFLRAINSEAWLSSEWK